jgi:membrane-bound ClpP family serine protease
MRLTIVVTMVAGFGGLFIALVGALSRHQKSGSRAIKLIGELATVETGLNPEGTVLVCGELWCAKSADGGAILSGLRVRVVGFQDHLALVEVCN